MSGGSAGILRADFSSPLMADDAARVTPGFFFRAAVVPFALTRMLLMAAGLFAVYRLPGARSPWWNQPTGTPIIDIWSHFDSIWYEGVARGGYVQMPAGYMSNIAFAPLFPMLMRIGCFFAGNSEKTFYVVGIVISNIALLVALGYLLALMLMDGHDRLSASRAAWAVLIFPTSFFLSACYPMSLYMALAMAAFYHARKQQWRLVGLLVGLAALSRPDGVLLSGALAVEYYLQRGFSIRRELFNLAWGPIGLFSWMACQWAKFGNPFAFVAVQSAWHSCSLWTVLHSTHAPLQLGPPVLFAVMTVMGLRRLRPSYTAFTILMGLLMLTANRYWSITRFVLVLFPCFMMLGMISRKHKWFHLAYTAVSASLSTFLMMRFALAQWVA